jgi:hypothetical protein
MIRILIHAHKWQYVINTYNTFKQKFAGNIFATKKWFKKGKAAPVTGRRYPYGAEASRLPHVLDNRLTDSGEVVSLKHRPPFTPSKILGTQFCYGLGGL